MGIPIPQDSIRKLCWPGALLRLRVAAGLLLG